jgi:hypothetical protein
METIRWVSGSDQAAVVAGLDASPPGGWLIASITSGLGAPRETAGTLAEFLATPAETLVVLDPKLTVLGRDLLAGSVGEALGHAGLLTLLVPPGPTPPVTGINHGAVRSFVGPASLLNAAPAGPAELTPETLCYWALWSVIHGANAGVIARECPEKRDGLPRWIREEPAGRLGSTAVIMAHRGPADFLHAALGGLAACVPRPDVVRVGLDVDAGELDRYRELAASFPHVEFYFGSRAPVGPYVIRQALASITADRFLVFHDSDDHSTHDRFHWLDAEMARGEPGLVGSHELRYDEDDREVRAVRFPLDVTAALKVEPKHPQLHPTTMVAVSDFHRAGGFSTDCVFGNDTQLMLRAFFHMPLRNVDRFLYIRRDRWESLTNAPETGMNNPLRIARNLAWWSDFEAVKIGRMPLETSCLMAVNGPGDWTLRPLGGVRAPGA